MPLANSTFWFFLTLIFFSNNVFSQTLKDISDQAMNHLSSIYEEGKTELHLPIFTYHFPFVYDGDTYDQLNRWPLGLGIGKGLMTQDGKWSGFYVISFADSHHDPQPSIVYSQTWPLVGSKQSNLSVGFVSFITARSDQWNYFPFPGVLPILSANLTESIKFTATYVPGFKHGTGNVLLFTSSYSF